MTVDHYVRFVLPDIRAIVCECKACKLTISVTPNSVKLDLLRKCPSLTCGKEWMATDRGSIDVPVHPAARFLVLFNEAAINGESLGCKLSFEMAAPE